MHKFRFPLIMTILSIGVALAAILFLQLSNYRFYPDNRTFMIFTYVGLIVVVLAAVALMFFYRKVIPGYRSLSDERQRLESFCKAYNSNYLLAFVSVVATSACVVLSNNTTLIMPLMVLILVLFFMFPNMYKAKQALALSDDFMKEVFGDKYIQ